MNTKHFDYMIAISETGNLSHAAARIGVSQPVLSRYLSVLEQQLETQLFIQENRRMHITEAGLIYLNGVRRMKELQTQMYRSFEQLSGHRELTLRIGISPFHGGLVLAYIYPRLLERYPNLDLHVEEGNTTDILNKLHQKKISAFSSLYDTSLMPDTKVATYTRTEVMLVLPDYHPLSRRNITGQAVTTRQLTVEELHTLDDIHFVGWESQTLMGQLISTALTRYNFSPQMLLQSANSITINTLLSTGSYAGFLMREVAEQTDGLTAFHLPHPLHLYTGLIFNKEHQPNEVEQYLFQLEYEHVKTTTPKNIYINDLGKRLLGGSVS